MDERHERIINSEDADSYWRFTKPARIDKAVSTLKGLLRGVAADGVIDADELGYLGNWVLEHVEFSNRHPFNELIPAVSQALADGALDPDEVSDLLWLCDRLSSETPYFSKATADMQQLQGVLAGMAADHVVGVDEVRKLRIWLSDHEGLQGCWPYDEVCSVITGVLQDGKIDEQEHASLLAFFREFSSREGHRAVDCFEPHFPITAKGICAVCPEVIFHERCFCFTGKSSRSSRAELAGVVERLGGKFCPNVRQDLDYLVVGAAGNEAWAYACYGRKVEQAVEYRKAGHAVCLVHELDFWEAAAEHDSA
jgi:hypothetical protein